MHLRRAVRGIVIHAAMVYKTERRQGLIAAVSRAGRAVMVVDAA